nr:MAG TPA: hypothetical protein [Caudoviricetes sp.]
MNLYAVLESCTDFLSTTLFFTISTNTGIHIQGTVYQICLFLNLNIYQHYLNVFWRSNLGYC